MKAATPSAPSSERRQRANPSASRRRPSSSVQVARRAGELAEHGDRVRRLGRDLSGHGDGGLEQLLVGDDALDEPPVVGRLRVDRLAGEVEEHRSTGTDEAREPLCPAAPGDQAELDLRLPELRGRRRNADVAAHGELEPSTEAEAVDRRDERCPRRVHPVPECVEGTGRSSFAGVLALPRETP